MELKYMYENLTNTQPEDETILVWKIHVVARQLKIMLFSLDYSLLHVLLFVVEIGMWIFVIAFVLKKSERHIFMKFSVDSSKKDKTSRVYFYSGFVAYFLGLVLTVLVMHTFKAAQPALLYLVPACLGTPITLALLRGEISDLFK